MLRVYPDLRVVLMSATIDTSLFSRYYGDCPIIEVEGKTHPVQGRERGGGRERGRRDILSILSEYFLEDAIQMVSFNPPPSDHKKKKSAGGTAEEEEEEEVGEHLSHVTVT